MTPSHTQIEAARESEREICSEYGADFVFAVTSSPGTIDLAENTLGRPPPGVKPLSKISRAAPNQSFEQVSAPSYLRSGNVSRINRSISVAPFRSNWTDWLTFSGCSRSSDP